MFHIFDGLELPLFIFILIAFVAAIATLCADKIADLGDYED